MKPLEVIGLDLGQVRTGVARGNTAARLAEPIGTVPTDKIFDYLEKLVKKHESGALVVGLPRNLSGKDTKQTKWVRSWAASAKSKVKLPIYLQDEALTTKAAGAWADDPDAAAAALILQDYLDSKEADKVLV